MWYNGIIKTILRTPLHGMLSSGIMLVTYTGRKSGRRVAVPVNYIRDGEDDSILWTTSLRKRTWWRNLRGGAPVMLRLRGRNRSALGTAIEDEEGVVAALGRYLQETPDFAKHFDIRLDDDRAPIEEDLIQAAQKRLMVRFQLQSGN
jgi:hypothetical protein